MKRKKTKFKDEEVIHEEVSPVSWEGKKMPVTLIKWPSGKMDVHCQTGDHHDKAIATAREILAKRGLSIGEQVMMGPSGIYYRVYGSDWSEDIDCISGHG